jgi:hypothetical protein
LYGGLPGAAGKARDKTIRRPFVLSGLGAKKRAARGCEPRLRRAAAAGQVRSSISSSNVKFRQVLSSFVKPLLDGGLGGFNGLPERGLTEARRVDLGQPTALRPGSDPETRIARLSPPAKNLSAA